MTESTVCPWCQTEIVWDKELGPEKHCPHCDNELDGYRTISLNLEEDEEELDEELGPSEEEYPVEEEDEASNRRPPHQAILALEDHVQQLLAEQEDMPECSSCREFMIEVGRQKNDSAAGFTLRETGESAKPLLRNAFEIVWYVCPSCFETKSRLSYADQHFFAQRLSEATE
ncbi:hypothetical protein ACFOQM_21815 [Paenibacillus sp. GCM10012307]|uniref:Uncharacterized protein n=1 Tax=Paenibacillus roseus TaxID=2798579 RepID=A0A934MX67_9BACL|nr:hypothetical protein [Paenibacillus roseus]MBJ6363867.1 hypothetical protein [Paenibacillus roseus]